MSGNESDDDDADADGEGENGGVGSWYGREKPRKQPWRLE